MRLFLSFYLPRNYFNDLTMLNPIAGVREVHCMQCMLQNTNVFRIKICTLYFILLLYFELPHLKDSNAFSVKKWSRLAMAFCLAITFLINCVASNRILVLKKSFFNTFIQKRWFGAHSQKLIIVGIFKNSFNYALFLPLFSTSLGRKYVPNCDAKITPK